MNHIISHNHLEYLQTKLNVINYNHQTTKETHTLNTNESTHSVCRDIFKAVHEGKWLSIEYQNKNDNITKYWIGIKDINPIKRTLKVEGLHLGKYTIETYDYIYIDSILESSIIEGTYCERNQQLIQDIYLNPEKYKGLFDHVANIKILNYLEDCNRMDVSVYKSEFMLINHIDRESFNGSEYVLDDKQFSEIVKNFQFRKKMKVKTSLEIYNN